ncbi:MAG: cysteine--tRNA ligase [Myxococcales bacterium]|nr:cysteine--tRNA ligase [Myxococcales bacterium]MCB9644195.1 cysteine--tRNA ligase [Myxococcales bacterium]
MSLTVYNSKTRQKEQFEPLQPGKVLMYVCGITPYDYSHIGHARCYVAFDVIYRYLMYAGFDVTYTRNYTDIDDKIIKRANERGVGAVELAAEFIEAYKKDMKALHVLPANHEPKVSETIKEIIEMVQTIVEREMAYVVDGDVYFRIDSMHDYGKLSGRNIEDLRSGARVEVDSRKENPLDFALWKSAKPGEPSWDSPWGQGRPGWHIECSAMSQKFLGDLFDIHGGGKDLLFPHHENEVAQSEACTGGKTHVRYWLHNGFVNIDNEKMSKSLDNFFTIREVLKLYHPETLRLFLLNTHYRGPINYSDSNLNEARKRLDYFYETLRKSLKTLDLTWEAVEGKAEGDFDKHFYSESPLRSRFVEALDDDFNAPKAMGEMSDLFSQLNQLADRGLGLEQDLNDRLLLDGLRYVKEFAQVFGVWLESPEAYLATPQGQSAENALTPDKIEALLVERREARAARNFQRADEIRKLLADNNIEIKDAPDGTTWKYAS